jgi:thiamine-phosphate pyrophosphorylase
VDDVRGRLRLYVVTSSGLVPGRTHLDVARAAIAGGATAVQLRAPELEERDLLTLATTAAAECRAAGVLFLVNDSIPIALMSGADGAHLGQENQPLDARDRAGADLVLGISVETPEQAAAAESAGADYLGVTVWATLTKPEARAHGLDGLRAVVAATSLPVVGIGGIDTGNARAVLDAGAAGVAVVSAVGAAQDPVAATRALVEVTRGRGVLDTDGAEG